MTYTEKRYAKIIDEQTKEVEVGIGYPDEHYIEIGMTLMDTDLAYNGHYYVSGYAPEEPEPTEEEKKIMVRKVRSEYFETYVDWYQSKPLLWEELSETEKQYRSEYREYLKDYTKEDKWWEQNPLDFESWLVTHHPVEAE